MKNLRAASDRWLLIASLILQIALGMFLGHAYDDRINMATGYLVASGQNPYVAQDLSSLFPNKGFQGMTSIGYPPLWPLVLGLIYQVSYKLYPNFLLYNLAIKIPIIIANFCLAFIVRKILDQAGAEKGKSRQAWIFLLFNPFFLLATTAWGQIDSIAVLLVLLALGKLVSGKRNASAILLALALSFKPIVIPLLPAIWVYLKKEPFSTRTQFLGSAIAFTAGFSALPFILLGWDPTIIFANWTAPISAGGGLSFLSFLDLVTGTSRLSGAWQLLGILWIPALIIAALNMKAPGEGWVPLLKISTGMILIFLIFKSWVSEPNTVLPLTMVLILMGLGELPRKLFNMAWALPLAFGFFNMAVVQLLFPIAPALMDRWMSGMGTVGLLWQILAALAAFAWLVYAGRTVIILLQNKAAPGIMDHAN